MKIHTKICIAAILFTVGVTSGATADTSSSAIVPAKSQKVTAVYDFVWNGFLIGTSDTVIDLADEKYVIDFKFRTRGVMKIFSSGRSQVTSYGKFLAPGEVLPKEFSSSGRWSGDDFARSVFYDDQGRAVGSQLDWPQEWLDDFKNEDVPVDMQQGADPLSVMLPVLTQPLPVTDKKDPAQHRFYTGRSVLDLLMACDGEADDLKKVRRSEHFGPAKLCRFNFKMIAGFPIETEEEKRKREKREAKERARAERDAKKGKTRKDEDDDDFIQVWFQDDASVPGLNLPVRGEFALDMGTVKMYLRELKGTAPVTQSGR
ncbi:hypothetical protein GCM10017044_11610 [Kordiimonas sediminis]|uniref:DUF3108 domain-containing protein n=1 Tax=Kordiimonas sediminis TaxID=1735581 RepID=A0A919AQK7_9PROT|nr:DUF3108 domain-containing protein [Kordiimonas sediminis]GHF18750.1 hypothetical protein GCM10017044_11610 [Kordiimonas sediminis]